MNDGAGTDGRAGGWADRPPLHYLPLNDLSRRLTELLTRAGELAAALPAYAWRSEPDPLPACRELDGLISTLEAIETAANEARMTCLFLWEIASSERERRDDG